MDHTQELTHLSLCTGYGGIDIGLSRALRGAVRTITYVEIEAFCVENLVSKIESELLDVAPVFTDLKRFPWELYREKVDLVSGGFPCQPFSNAGRRAGDDDPRHLFPYILDGLQQMGRPPLVFLENVEGIISSKLKGDGWSDPAGTSVLLHVLRELERLGYTATAGVFSAREIGAPHQRKRVFIMGCRSDLGTSGRDLISELLRRGRDRTALEDPSDRGIGKRESNAHQNGRALDRRWESLSRRRDSQTDNSWATDSAYPAPLTVDNTESGQNPRREPPNHDRESEEDREESFLLSRDRGGNSYPAPRGRDQYRWEPPRVTREAQSEMGRDLDGTPDRMDYAELSRSMDNRTDELRMLGNGVVPDTAARAFRVLWGQLTNENEKGSRHMKLNIRPATHEEIHTLKEEGVLLNEEDAQKLPAGALFTGSNGVWYIREHEHDHLIKRLDKALTLPLDHHPVDRANSRALFEEIERVLLTERPIEPPSYRLSATSSRDLEALAERETHRGPKS